MTAADELLTAEAARIPRPTALPVPVRFDADRHAPAWNDMASGNRGFHCAARLEEGHEYMTLS